MRNLFDIFIDELDDQFFKRLGLEFNAGSEDNASVVAAEEAVANYYDAFEFEGDNGKPTEDEDEPVLCRRRDAFSGMSYDDYLLYSSRVIGNTFRVDTTSLLALGKLYKDISILGVGTVLKCVASNNTDDCIREHVLQNVQLDGSHDEDDEHLTMISVLARAAYRKSKVYSISTHPRLAFRQGYVLAPKGTDYSGPVHDPDDRDTIIKDAAVDSVGRSPLGPVAKGKARANRKAILALRAMRWTDEFLDDITACLSAVGFFDYTAAAGFFDYFADKKANNPEEAEIKRLSYSRRFAFVSGVYVEQARKEINAILSRRFNFSSVSVAELITSAVSVFIDTLVERHDFGCHPEVNLNTLINSHAKDKTSLVTVAQRALDQTITYRKNSITIAGAICRADMLIVDGLKVTADAEGDKYIKVKALSYDLITAGECADDERVLLSDDLEYSDEEHGSTGGNEGTEDEVATLDEASTLSHGYTADETSEETDYTKITAGQLMGRFLEVIDGMSDSDKDVFVKKAADCIYGEHRAAGLADIRKGINEMATTTEKLTSKGAVAKCLVAMSKETLRPEGIGKAAKQISIMDYLADLVGDK
jgi:hypothetical protein